MMAHVKASGNFHSFQKGKAKENNYKNIRIKCKVQGLIVLRINLTTPEREAKVRTGIFSLCKIS